MKNNLKKYWQSLVAFAVCSAMCLGVGIFMLAMPNNETNLENQQKGQTQFNSNIEG